MQNGLAIRQGRGDTAFGTAINPEIKKSGNQEIRMLAVNALPAS